MADISIEKGPSNLSWVWALAAILATGGLMFWLFTTRPPEGSTAVTTDPETPAEAPPVAEPAELAAVGAAPANFMGRPLRISNVPVTAPIGSRVFLADVPGASPMLVVVAPEVTDVSWVTEGSTVAAAEGTVEAVSEQKLNELVTSGALLAEGRNMAIFSTHYLNVTNVQR
jgi:hypothetical protein